MENKKVQEGQFTEIHEVKNPEAESQQTNTAPEESRTDAPKAESKMKSIAKKVGKALLKEAAYVGVGIVVTLGIFGILGAAAGGKKSDDEDGDSEDSDQETDDSGDVTESSDSGSSEE